MPAGMGLTGRNGRAGRPTEAKTTARTPTKIILRRRAVDGDFGFTVFMPSCYGKIITGRESKKMRGSLKKRIAQIVTTIDRNAKG
jgi:hypothetical protein